MFFRHSSTIALFQKAIVQMLLSKCKKGSISKFTLFHTFCTITQRATKSVIIHLHIFKERQNVRSHIHTLLRSDKMCDRTFLKSNKGAIAHVYIFKEQQNVQLHICTFEYAIAQACNSCIFFYSIYNMFSCSAHSTLHHQMI